MLLKMFSKCASPLGRHFLWFSLFLSQYAAFNTNSAHAQTDILTQRYNNARTGTNLAETTLNLSNVNVETFGKLFSRDVDGEIYAQPLLVSNLMMPGQGKRNVVFVATEHNSLYAFDAENPDASTPFWHRQMGPPVPVTDVGSACGVYKDFSKEIGITGTPVIDAASQTIYVVARTKIISQPTPPKELDVAAPETAAPEQEAVVPVAGLAPLETAPSTPSSWLPLSPPTYHQYLHALDLRTGQERPGSPVEIKASVPGTGGGSKNGVLAFDPLLHNQRPALLLHNGVVYISWAGHCDTGPYHGWVIATMPRHWSKLVRSVPPPMASGLASGNPGLGPWWMSKATSTW
jgi:hypothetical protein